MPKTFLILGREPSLSFAEIFHFLGDETKINAYNRQAVLVTGENLSQSGPALLGGVIKAGQVVATEKYPVAAGELAAHLTEILRNLISGKGKFNFGLSLYPPSPFQGEARPVAKRSPVESRSSSTGRSFCFGGRVRVGELGKTKDLGLKIKHELKAGGRSVRFVQSRHQNLSAADVVKNRLLDRGIELCLIQTNKQLYIGQTLAVQPFEQYSARDFGRPARDAKRGLLPPKLAKIMLNLAAIAENEVGLDPFCGSGTILQEGLLAGYQMAGSDKDPAAVELSRRNLAWLREKYGFTGARFSLRQLDVLDLPRKFASSKFDAVVTEFDLGPALQGGESRQRIIDIEKGLSDFYRKALTNIRPVLKKEGRLVLAWPYFKKFNLLISLFSELESLGWEIVCPFPEEYENVFPLSGRHTLIYGRPDQYVFREILILEKSKAD